MRIISITRVRGDGGREIVPPTELKIGDTIEMDGKIKRSKLSVIRYANLVAGRPFIHPESGQWVVAQEWGACIMGCPLKDPDNPYSERQENAKLLFPVPFGEVTILDYDEVMS